MFTLSRRARRARLDATLRVDVGRRLTADRAARRAADIRATTDPSIVRPLQYRN